MHRTRADLDLLGRAVLDQLPALDPADQLRVEPEDAVEPQHMGDEVVGEHRQPLEVAEVGDARPVQIGGGDLRALEERDARPS